MKSPDSAAQSSPVQRLYDLRVHGGHYPIGPSAHVPNRYSSIVEQLIRLRGNEGFSPMLEIGSESPSNPAFLASKLGMNLSQVTCVEISSHAASRLEESGIATRQLDISTDPLPFPDGTFALIVLSEVIEHLLDPDYALDEVRRVLKPGGLAVITTPNLASWFNRLILPLGLQPVLTETGTLWNLGWGSLRPRKRPVGHLRILTSKSLVELLNVHKLTVLRLRGLALEPPMNGSSILGALDKLVAMFPSFAAGVMAITRREPIEQPSG